MLSTIIVGNNNNSILRNMKIFFLKTNIDLSRRQDRDLNINVISSCHLEDKEKSTEGQTKLKLRCLQLSRNY